jgi:hypothetical protein
MKTVTGMGGMGGARELAEMLRQMGRGPDTVLAHITPEEAEMLMQMGGSGNMNPNTGLPEFQREPDYGELLASETYGPAPSYEGPDVPFADLSFPAPDYGSQMRAADIAADTGYYGQQAYQMPQPEVDIGFGPGQFTPPVSRRDIAGMPQAQVDQLIGQQPSMISQAAGAVEGGLSDIRQTLSKYPNLSAVLATGAQSLPALLNARRMQRETERSAAELRALGAPLREQGEALRQQALAGRLTPQQAAAQEAARARLRQGGANRGVTTGTQQAMIENQLAASRAAQSEVNLNNALKQLNLANAYDEAAIRAKLAGDREMADILSTVAGNIASGVASQAPRRQTAAAPTQRPSAMPEEPITRRPEVRS